MNAMELPICQADLMAAISPVEIALDGGLMSAWQR